MQYSKLSALLHSRKFWALVLALVGTALAVEQHQVTIDTGILAAVGSLSAYMVGTGLDSPSTVLPMAGSTTNLAGPTTVIPPPLVDGHEIPRG